MRRLAAVSIAGLAVAVAGCGDGRPQVAQNLSTLPSADAERADVALTPSDVVVSEIVTDRVILSTDRLEQLVDEVVQTEQLLVRRSYGECMVRLGFIDNDPPSVENAYRPQTVDLRYGTLDVDKLSAALKVVKDRPAASEPTSQDGSTTSPEYISALYGSRSDYLSDEVTTPEGTFKFEVPSGCVGAAIEQVHGSRQGKIDVDTLIVLGQSLSNQSFTEMLKDDDVRTSIAGWSECMSKSGFAFVDPWSIPVDDMSLDQRAVVATADVECKAASGLVDAASTAEVAWQNAHASEIDGILRQLDSVLDHFHQSM